MRVDSIAAHELTNRAIDHHGAVARPIVQNPIHDTLQKNASPVESHKAGVFLVLRKLNYLHVG